MITLARRRPDRGIDEVIDVSGTVSVNDVFDVARSLPEGRLLLDVCNMPDSSTGDLLRLLAFYCDRKDGIE